MIPDMDGNSTVLAGSSEDPRLWPRVLGDLGADALDAFVRLGVGSTLLWQEGMWVWWSLSGGVEGFLEISWVVSVRSRYLR